MLHMYAAALRIMHNRKILIFCHSLSLDGCFFLRSGSHGGGGGQVLPPDQPMRVARFAPSRLRRPGGGRTHGQRGGLAQHPTWRSVNVRRETAISQCVLACGCIGFMAKGDQTGIGLAKDDAEAAPCRSSVGAELQDVRDETQDAV